MIQNYLISSGKKNRGKNSTMSGNPMIAIKLIIDFMQAIFEKRSPSVSGSEALKTQALISELLRAGQRH
jgi:hypothetical protein